MATSGGNLQSTLHRLLALYLGEVGTGLWGSLTQPRGRGGDGGLTGKMAYQVHHMVHRVDCRAAGQGGLGGVGAGDKEGADALRLGVQSHGQHPSSRTQLAGQGQLPHKGAVPGLDFQLSGCRQQAHQNGQVIEGAHLFHMGGCQIDGDTADREGETAVFDGGAYPLPCLVYRRVGQTHNGEGGQAAGQIALHRHGITGDTMQAERTHVVNHGKILQFKEKIEKIYG